MLSVQFRNCLKVSEYQGSEANVLTIYHSSAAVSEIRESRKKIQSTFSAD